MPPAEFASAAELEAWLEANHGSSDGIWLKAAKKGTAGVSYAEALTLALCFGWIDSQKKALPAAVHPAPPPGSLVAEES